MNLLENENEIISLNGKRIILTNYRIIQNDQLAGKSYSISIFLENISSIENQYKSSPVYLIIAGVAFIGGIGYESLMVGVIAGLIFVALWWFSRKHLITIKSNGGSSLNILAEKMKKKDIENFVFNIVKAKSERINKIHKI